MKTPDPRVMLLIAACFSTVGVLVQHTLLLLSIFLCCVFFSIMLGANMFVIVKKLKGLLGIIVFVALMQSLFSRHGGNVVSIGDFGLLTTGGLLMAANTLLRMGTIIASAAIFTLTTSRRMIQGLIQLKVPYEIAFMSSVALRFLPVFSEEFRDTLTAIQLRGVDIKRIPLGQKLRTYGSIIMPVTYGAVDRAQKLSYAMELRAFRAMPKRTSRITLKLSAADYAYMGAFLILTAGVLLYYYLVLQRAVIV